MARNKQGHISEQYQEVRDALLLVLHKCKDPYAKSYASAGLESWRIQDEAGLKTQVLYVIGNVGGWRGEIARKAKKVLRAFTSELI